MTLSVRPWIVGQPTVLLLTHRNAWSYCKAAIRAEVGDEAYDNWLGSLSLVEVKRWVARLSVVSPFLKKWIDTHYKETLLRAIQGEWPAVSHVEISVRTCIVKDIRTQPVLLLPGPPARPTVPAHKRFAPYTPERLFPGHPNIVRGQLVIARVVFSRVKIEDIQRAVARHYNVSRADMLSSRRTMDIVKPRQVAMYLARALTDRSFPEIGWYFGGRDHTTVLHAVNKIAWAIGERGEKVPVTVRHPDAPVDEVLKQEVEMLRQALEPQAAAA